MNQEFRQLKISESELIKLVRPLTPGELASSNEAVSLFCAAAWSQLCEPGDALAGMLCEVLGAQHSLSLVIARAEPKVFVDQIATSGYLTEATSRFADLASVVESGLERWSLRLSMSELVASLEAHAKLSGKLVIHSNPIWPTGLCDLGWSSPRTLWARGSLATLGEFSRTASLVGSRSATNYAEHVVTELVSGLVEQSITVVSGGAFGVDALAHRSTMALEGKTVAIMAGGLDRLYPIGNSDVLNRILETGLIIGELPPGVPPTKWRFLQRNRLIAAISAATVVIEAGAKSGSINTANHALELNRPVGAIPGPITSQNSVGCHRLIRDHSAQLVTSSADILEMMGIWREREALDSFRRGPLETRVYDAIGFGSKTLEAICREAGVTPTEAAIAIGSLEISGHIERRSNQWQRAQ